MENLRTALLVSVIGNILGLFAGVILAVLNVVMPEWLHSPKIFINYVEARPLAKPFSFRQDTYDTFRRLGNQLAVALEIPRF